jgi:hypothetical protein
MFNQPRQPCTPGSTMAYSQPDPARVGLVRFEPFKHFCVVCGADAPFGFDGDFSAGQAGVWACHAHRADRERKWQRT